MTHHNDRPDEDTYYKVRSAGRKATKGVNAGADGEGAAATGSFSAPIQPQLRPHAHTHTHTHAHTHAHAPPAPGAHGYGSPCGTSGSGCAGSFGKDLDFEMVPAPAALAAQGVVVFRGNTTRSDEHGVKGAAAIVLRDVPASITLKAGGAVQQFIAAVVTTVAKPATYDPVPDAIAEYELAAANASLLVASHSKAWSDIWTAGSVSVLGVEDDATGKYFKCLNPHPTGI